MIGIFHFQVKLHLLLVFKVVVEMNRESIILRLYLIDIHSVVGKLALRDFHGRMAATERDFELVQIVETRIVYADAEVAGFIVVGGMVAVAFCVVDFQGVENQIRSIGRNGADEMLVAVIILLGDGEFHLRPNLLRRNGDGLRFARRNVKTDDLSIGTQADNGAFVGLYLILVAASGNYGQHFHSERLRHFAVKGHVGVAVLVEQVIGDFLHAVVSPRGLAEEEFSGGVAESGTDEIGFVLRAVGGHEVGPHVVVGTPNVNVVDEGIGHLRGRDEAQRAKLVAVECLGKTAVSTIVIEPPREAVVRHDKSQVLVSQSFDITNAVTRFAPNLLSPVVAVLDEERAAVDGLVHRIAIGAPVGEVRHGLRNVAAAIRPEIIEHGVGVLVSRPAAAGCALVDGVLADGVLAEFVGPKAVYHLGAKLEPTLQLESHRCDGLVVEVGIGGRLSLIIKVFLDDMVHFFGGSSRDAAQNDVGHVVIAHHGIDMVGNVRVVAVAARVVVHRVGNDALGAVAAVVAKEKHRRWRHVPCVVGITDEVADGRLGVASAVAHGKNLSRDALLHPELLDAVGQGDKVLIVRRDNHVFTSCFAVFVMLAEAFSVVHFGQVVMVDDDVLQDLVPFGGAIAQVADGAVAAFYVNFQLQIAVNDQFLGDRIVLERHHAHLNHLNATDAADLRNSERRFGIEGVAPIDFGVFTINGGRIVIIQLRLSRRNEVDILDDLSL